MGLKAFVFQFRTQKKNTHAVVYVGSYSIKGVIFEIGENLRPKVAKKIVYYLPRFLGDEKAVVKLREYVFSMVKTVGLIPGKITIGLGPHFGEHALVSWSREEPAGIKVSSGKDLENYFFKLFEEHREPEKATIAFPSELFVNHYPAGSLAVGARGEKTTLAEKVSGAKIVTFQSIIVYLQNEIGNQLFDIKHSLGGMPIEFVPSLAAEKEAMLGALKVQNGFFVHVGGEETTLFLLKKGELACFSIFKVGANHFFRGIAEVFSVSFREADEIADQYAKGMTADGRRGKMKEFMELQAIAWKKNFLKACGAFFAAGPLSPQVLVYGRGARISEIAAALRADDWMRDLSYATKPEVRVLEAQAVFGGDTFAGTIKDTDEVTLASLIYYSLHHEPLLK